MSEKWTAEDQLKLEELHERKQRVQKAKAESLKALIWASGLPALRSCDADSVLGWMETHAWLLRELLEPFATKPLLHPISLDDQA